MAKTNAEWLELIESAMEAVLLGKDVMFEGQRITMEDFSTLEASRDRFLKKINAAGGNGMAKNNVGLKKRY